jgi:hypothetical protein
VAGTTTNRDFKVKHGLDVAQGGTFGGTVTVATPTENTHATTKLYVDNKTSSVIIASGAEFPESPVNGQMFYDTVTDHIFIYYSSAWSSIAMYNDTIELQQHIHDTAIDGTGLVVSTFKDAGFYDEAGDATDAGFYNTVAWQVTWDGGISVDNFN